MDKKVYIYGRHALKEALISAPGSVVKVFLANRNDAELEALLAKAGVPVGALSSSVTEKEASHQGIVANISPEKLFTDLPGAIKVSGSRKISFVFLAGVQDPQNVGAIIRSAAAFGVSGVIMPKKEQAGITGAVAKASSGMIFRVPLISADDPAETLLGLKVKGFAIYGLDGTSKNRIDDEKFDQPAVFVMGNESSGIPREIGEICDRIVSIPMDPRCESLNVAVAAGITFYEWKKRSSRNEDHK